MWWRAGCSLRPGEVAATSGSLHLPPRLPSVLPTLLWASQMAAAWLLVCQIGTGFQRGPCQSCDGQGERWEHVPQRPPCWGLCVAWSQLPVCGPGGLSSPSSLPSLFQAQGGRFSSFQEPQRLPFLDGLPQCGPHLLIVPLH